MSQVGRAESVQFALDAQTVVHEQYCLGPPASQHMHVVLPMQESGAHEPAAPAEPPAPAVPAAPLAPPLPASSHVKPQKGPEPFGAQNPQARGPQQNEFGPQKLAPHGVPPPSLVELPPLATAPELPPLAAAPALPPPPSVPEAPPELAPLRPPVEPESLSAKELVSELSPQLAATRIVPMLIALLVSARSPYRKRTR
jgi:hypothetical protein